MVEERDTRLPLLLSPFRRTSQWSDMEELVEPTEGEREVSVTMGTGPERYLHMPVPFQSIQKTHRKTTQIIPMYNIALSNRNITL